MALPIIEVQQLLKTALTRVKLQREFFFTDIHCMDAPQNIPIGSTIKVCVGGKSPYVVAPNTTFR
jgi:hypothetical protein